jgi:ATP-dependent Clp protease ATP-binding subunit ClpX
MLLDVRNGEDGVIFAIDEIHAEFSSNAWKDFPPELLREISQQRKQKVKIIASAQVFKDVAVQLRRQCFDVVECRTVGGRWTFQRCFDAEDYNAYVESNATAEKKFAVPLSRLITSASSSTLTQKLKLCAR